jgi:hypothetical protein
MNPNQAARGALALTCIAIAVVGVMLFMNSCSGPQLPEELKLKRELHHKEVSHAMGPGGINHSFTVYELPKDASATIANQGLTYLNSLPSVARQKRNFEPPRVETWSSPRHQCDVAGCPKCKDPENIITHTATGPYWAPFVTWKATPVPKEVQWLRRGDKSDLEEKWQPSLATFYTRFYKGSTEKNPFISKISPEFIDAFDEAISTPGSFYAYGYYRDMCLLVVSPKTGKAFYLFRD